MKKIITTTLLIMVIGAGLRAQQAQKMLPLPDGAQPKMMSFDEANRLNGVVEPTIDGKPYSQFKAEQDALKQQQLATQTQAITPKLPQQFKLPVAASWTNKPTIDTKMMGAMQKKVTEKVVYDPQSFLGQQQQ